MAATLSVDYRERALIEALANVPHTVENLAVGDIVCQHGKYNTWIAERKRVDDLAQSIKRGRWRDQVARLHATRCRHVFFLVEGDLRSTGLSHESLLGACVNAELRPSSHVIRTADLAETAAVVRHLVQKAESTPGLPRTVLTPPVSKRQRSADRTECWVRMLMCVPSVSEKIARKLLDTYGTLPAIQRALADLITFKRVPLHKRTCLGIARMKKLAFYLRDAEEETGGTASAVA